MTHTGIAASTNIISLTTVPYILGYSSHMGVSYSLDKRKEWLSRAYITAVATTAGYSTEFRVDDLDGEDAHVRDGGVQVEFQLKATAHPDFNQDHRHLNFDLDVRTYNKLRDPVRSAPGYLMVMILPSDPEEWLSHRPYELAIHYHAYWVALTGLPPSSNLTSQRVHVPLRNKMNAARLQSIMRRARSRLQ